jgi:hypothetical protein
VATRVVGTGMSVVTGHGVKSGRRCSIRVCV